MKHKEETLLLLIPGFPSSEADSVCLPMQQQLVRSVRELNPRLNIVILSFQYPYTRKTYTCFGATVIAFAGRNKGGLARLQLRRKLNATLNRLNSTTRIIGLLSFWYGECARTGQRFARKHGIKHYCWILGQDAKRNNPYPQRVHLRSNQLIALSDFLQEEFERNHGTRPRHVVPPGMDAKQFDLPAGEKDIDLLAAGSLLPLKQYDVFLDIVASIKNKIPAIKAVLAGNGPEKERLRNIAASLGLQDNILFTGEIPHARLLCLMQRSRVFIHPSSYEGFSGVCLEALYSGAHVLSFCRPMRHEITHWHIAGSANEMKRITLDLLQNPVRGDQTTSFPAAATANNILQLFIAATGSPSPFSEREQG